jgi:hypothetical protein
MSWNYRVVMNAEGEYAIHEVFYNMEGEIKGATAQPVYPRGDSYDDLAAELERYSRALEAPILTMADIDGSPDRPRCEDR